MKATPVNAKNAPQTSGGHSQAVLLECHERLLFISGQIPETIDGSVPQDFKTQCDLVWQILEPLLPEILPPSPSA